MNKGTTEEKNAKQKKQQKTKTKQKQQQQQPTNKWGYQENYESNKQVIQSIPTWKNARN